MPNRSYISTVLPNHQSATFTYLQWQELYNKEKPFEVFAKIPKDAEDQRWTNQVFEEGPLEHVKDVRGNETAYTLDKHGFAFRSNRSELVDFDDHDAVERIYFPEMEALILGEVEDAKKVFIFNWERRSSVRKQLVPGEFYDAAKHPFLPPARNAHIDQTPHSAVGRVRLHMGEEADKLLKGRVQIINVWRPLQHPVEDFPLALADGRTVDLADCITADVVRNSYVGETAWLKYNAHVKWHYLSKHQPDEVIIFKNFDSKPGVTKYCPHAAFSIRDIEDVHPHAPRETIEVRALVFSVESDAKGITRY